jgi:fructokinase
MASESVSIESPSICVDRTAVGGTCVPVQRRGEPNVPHGRGVPTCPLVIVVAGEALVDLVVADGGVITATVGGAPYNVARGCARLGAPTALLAAVSTDRFGQDLAAGLASAGVSAGLVRRTALPTTLAVAELDEGGTATYRFYTEGTSTPALVPTALPAATDVLVTGGLGLVLEPMAAVIESLVLEAGEGVLVLVDVNCRPSIIVDRDGYLARLWRVLGRADVVKVSDEDLAWLRPGVAASVAAGELLDRGPRAALVTAGGRATTIVTRAGAATVPVASVPVVDTIGAGDAFTAGFATSWRDSGRGRAGLEDMAALAAAVTAAHTVAAVVVGRRGADPPHRADLPAGWGTRF